MRVQAHESGRYQSSLFRATARRIGRNTVTLITPALPAEPESASACRCAIPTCPRLATRYGTRYSPPRRTNCVRRRPRLGEVAIGRRPAVFVEFHRRFAKKAAKGAHGDRSGATAPPVRATYDSWRVEPAPWISSIKLRLSHREAHPVCQSQRPRSRNERPFAVAVSD